MWRQQLQTRKQVSRFGYCVRSPPMTALKDAHCSSPFPEVILASTMASSPTKPRDLGHSQEPLWEGQPLSAWGNTPPLYSGVPKLLPCPNPKTLATFLTVPRCLLQMRYPITVVHDMEKTKLRQNGKLCLLVSIASSPGLSR